MPIPEQKYQSIKHLFKSNTMKYFKFYLLTVCALIALKIIKVMTWSWWLVLAPVYLPVVGLSVLVIIAVLGLSQFDFPDDYDNEIF